MKNINILKWALVLGIVIVLNLFINVSIALVYDQPEWDKFCVQKQVTVSPDTQEKCVAGGGAWTENAGYTMDAKPVTAPSQIEPKGYCDVNFTCQKDYSEALSVYNRNVFIVLVVAGVVSLGAGFFLAQYTAVSFGLSFGGVLSFVIGSVRYWSDMDDYLRVIILGLALAVLIWIGVKKIKD
jgi:hypothetical protein